MAQRINKKVQYKLSLIDKFKYLFSNPNLFFDKIKNEKSLHDSLLAYLIAGLFIAIINFGYSMINNGSISMVILGISYFFPFLLVIIGLLFTFLYAAIAHIVVINFKHKGDYSDTFKIIAYSLIPFILVSWIPWMVVSILDAVIWNSSWYIVLAALLFSIAAFVYSLILMTIGISKIYTISKGKASLAALLPVIICLVLIIILIIFLFFGFFRGSMF